MNRPGGDVADLGLSPTNTSAPSDREAVAPVSAQHIPGDLLRAVLHRLTPADVARAACVCRHWHAVASDRAVLEAAFRAPWGVRRVVGEPATRAFWRAASLGRYALSHTIRRGDTVPGIAVKYSVQVSYVFYSSSEACYLLNPPCVSGNPILELKNLQY
jgi:hypothetical protein